jgi:hypothetical protein
VGNGVREGWVRKRNGDEDGWRKGLGIGKDWGKGERFGGIGESIFVGALGVVLGDWKSGDFLGRPRRIDDGRRDGIGGYPGGGRVGEG